MGIKRRSSYSNDLDRAIYVFSILASRRDCQGENRKLKQRRRLTLSHRTVNA